MKVLLIKDVFKLGRAGDVKRVADGYGRNFLLPQGLGVLATPGALRQVEMIRKKATAARAELNSEMSSIAEVLTGAVITFGTRAGDTGKLYGSITTQMMVDEINKKYKLQLDRHQIEAQPIRNLGEFKILARLTVDLTPEIKVIVHREGEQPDLPEAAEGESKPAVEPEPATVPENAVEAEPAVEAETATEPEIAVEAETAAEPKAE
jgi:large subunit ribosomal protein L9